MKSIVKIFGLISIILVVACKEETSNEAIAFETQMKKTIQIHDDVMPKMSSINNLISKLEAEKNELEAKEDSDSDEIKIYQSAINNLKEGHDLMMSWMKSFSNSFSRAEINSGLNTKNQDSIKAKLNLLDAQYESAQNMKNSINQALENAERILAN